VTSDNSRQHEERFRCPQCGRMVTVSAGFQRKEKGDEAMVSFQCTMEGMCGSPIWDPCPMYMAYMERAPKAPPEKKAQKKKTVNDDLKEAW